MGSRLVDRLSQVILVSLSRREMAGVLGLFAVAIPGSMQARKKRRKRRKRIKRNAFGCVNVGGACRTGGQCCSGICQGKQGRKRCQAHNASTCTGTDGCSAEFVGCITENGVDGTCNVTTGGASFCTTSAVCFDCTVDADCVTKCGAGAACLDCAECLPLGRQTACASATADGCVPT